LILAYQGLEEENLDQKSPGPPGWGLMEQASPLLIEKKRTAKKPRWRKTGMTDTTGERR
jgi:hypothetical protein